MTFYYAPDTCSCEFWLDNDSGIQPYPIEKIKRCDSHQNIDDDHECYDIVGIENRSKNNALSHFMDEFPEHTEEVPEPVDNTQTLIVDQDTFDSLDDTKLTMTEPRPRRLKKEVKMIYVFTGNDKERTLQVKFHGAKLNNSNKKRLQSLFKKKLEHKKIAVR